MSLKNSRALGWSAMLLMIVVIFIAMWTGVISEIWEYSVLFFAFMAIFCHLAALFVAQTSGTAARKLDIIALVFGILGVIDLIVIFILNFIAFY